MKFRETKHIHAFVIRFLEFREKKHPYVFEIFVKTYGFGDKGFEISETNKRIESVLAPPPPANIVSKILVMLRAFQDCANRTGS